MKVAFDTNVLLDIILRRPGFEDSFRLITVLSDNKILGVVSANSITDFYYLAKKRIGKQAARNAIFYIIYMFDVVPVDGAACFMALAEPMNDYEDAVLALCAKQVKADYIATRDRKFRNTQSPVPVRTPTELMRIIEEEET